jgi:hypothetical protein
MTSLKICTSCHHNLPPSEFYNSNSSRCKVCDCRESRLSYQRRKSREEATPARESLFHLNYLLLSELVSNTPEKGHIPHIETVNVATDEESSVISLRLARTYYDNRNLIAEIYEGSTLEKGFTGYAPDIVKAVARHLSKSGLKCEVNYE